VRLGDRCCQGQAEAGAPARPRVIRAAETLEGMWQELGREALSLVHDVELDVPVAVDRAQADVARTMPEGVVDEVAECLLEAEPVAGETHAVRRLSLDRAARLLGPRLERLLDGCQEVGCAELVVAERQAAVVGLREHEQILGEPDQPVRLRPRRPKRLLQLGPRSRLPEREIELGLHQRERSAKLVARIGDEASFPLDGSFEACQHGVERLAQARDLVPGLAGMQPSSGILPRDRSRLGTHRLHRSQRGSGEHVTERGAEQQRDRSDDHELREQLPEGLVAVAE
jgi:hypothetical protein